MDRKPVDKIERHQPSQNWIDLHHILLHFVFESSQRPYLWLLSLQEDVKEIHKLMQKRKDHDIGQTKKKKEKVNQESSLFC